MYGYLLLLSSPRKGICISIEQNMLMTEQFIQSLIIRHGRHNIPTDSGA